VKFEMFCKEIRIDWRSRFSIWRHPFKDDGHDVISRNKVLPPVEWTRSVCRRLSQTL